MRVILQCFQKELHVGVEELVATSGKVLDSFLGFCIILIDFMVTTKFMTL